MGQPLHRSATGPALWLFPITPNDSTDLTDYIRAVILGASGTIAYHDWDGVPRTTNTLPAGQSTLLARRILATGTSVAAGNITGCV
jgi:hypothetical protein